MDPFHSPQIRPESSTSIRKWSRSEKKSSTVLLQPTPRSQQSYIQLQQSSSTSIFSKNLPQPITPASEASPPQPLTPSAAAAAAATTTSRKSLIKSIPLTAYRSLGSFCIPSNQQTSIVQSPFQPETPTLSQRLLPQTSRTIEQDLSPSSSSSLSPRKKNQTKTTTISVFAQFSDQKSRQSQHQNIEKEKQQQQQQFSQFKHKPSQFLSSQKEASSNNNIEQLPKSPQIKQSSSKELSTPIASHRRVVSQYSSNNISINLIPSDPDKQEGTITPTTSIIQKRFSMQTTRPSSLKSQTSIYFAPVAAATASATSSSSKGNITDRNSSTPKPTHNFRVKSTSTFNNSNISNNLSHNNNSNNNIAQQTSTISPPKLSRMFSTMLTQVNTLNAPSYLPRGSAYLASNSSKKEEILANLADKKQAFREKKLQQILPIQLQDVLEKPFKVIAATIAYALKHSTKNASMNGPQLAIEEYEFYTVFRRVADQIPIIMKRKADLEQLSYRIKPPTTEEMRALVRKKITELAETLIEIEHKANGGSTQQNPSVKDTKYSKVAHKFFEGLSYLRFVFFNTDLAAAAAAAIDSIQSHSSSETTTTSATATATVTGSSSQKQLQESTSPSASPPTHKSKQDCPLPLLKDASLCYERLIHETFSKFFTPSDFNVLLEHVVMQDCKVILDRATKHLHKYFARQLAGISETVKSTMQNFFEGEQQLLFLKKRPHNIKEIYTLQTPNFSQTARPTLQNQANPHQKLAGIVDQYTSDLSSTIKRFQVKSPYHQDFDLSLKANLLKMYHTNAQASLQLPTN